MRKGMKTKADHNQFIVAKLREAFPKASRHQTFGKRALDVFKAALPEYEISAGGIGNTVMTLKIWQGWEHPDTTLGWDNRFSLSIGVYEKPWYTNFLRELDIADLSDYIERREAEKPYEAWFAELEKRVYQARALAMEHFKTMPVPSSATVRSAKTFWDEPSSELKTKFPALFGKLG
jgi:hypothetical protein